MDFKYTIEIVADPEEDVCSFDQPFQIEFGAVIRTNEG